MLIHPGNYRLRDYYAYDAMSNVEWDEINTYAVSDIYASQQIIFHCNLGGDNVYVECDTTDPDVIIMSKEISIGYWPFIITNEDIQQFDLEKRTLVYENEYYYVYQ